MKVIYTALFVKDTDQLLKNFPAKHPNVFAHHSTISFRPPNPDGVEISKEVKVRILARVSDEKGDALIIENDKSENLHPHITISCADNIPPRYSNEMIEEKIRNNSIEYFEEPIEIEMVEGYFDGSEDII